MLYFNFVFYRATAPRMAQRALDAQLGSQRTKRAQAMLCFMSFLLRNCASDGAMLPCLAIFEFGNF
ncbi:MAG: hypothetical protein HC777_02405 [Hyphomonadaceae bacterium]|nr:hypothetical protein [Hyphomonadaceae bacterium]